MSPCVKTQMENQSSPWIRFDSNRTLKKSSQTRFVAQSLSRCHVRREKSLVTCTHTCSHTTNTCTLTLRRTHTTHTHTHTHEIKLKIKINQMRECIQCNTGLHCIIKIRSFRIFLYYWVIVSGSYYVIQPLQKAHEHCIIHNNGNQWNPIAQMESNLN